ncbi:MAG: DUF2007 domain-containing protein [Marinifilaceae bacterium]|jgi:hypothetical protein
MTEGHNLVHVYTGSQVEVEYIRERLEESGINCLVKDDFQTGIHAGFVAGGPDAIEIYVEEADVPRAMKFIESL